MKDSLAIILWPLFVLVVGLVIYFAASNPKVAEVGRVAYAIGLLWTVYDLATRVVRF